MLITHPPTTDVRLWSVATFPSMGQREEFLQQVRLWNMVEGLPEIEAMALKDGMRLCFS